MRARIPIRRSRAAGWARFVGSLAVPVLALAALAARAGIASGPVLVSVLALGFLLALSALGLAVYALVDIWREGAEGAGAASAGLVYALPALLLLAGVTAAALVYPRLTDVSTDLGDPPTLVDAPALASPQSEAERAALQGSAFPDIAPRRYALPIGLVYTTAQSLLQSRGWEVTRDVPPPSAPRPAEKVEASPRAVEDEALTRALSAKGVAVQSRQEVLAALPPPEQPQAPEPESAVLQAVARTPLFGFADHIVLRLRESGGGTIVDARSASGIGMHDLGQNARRIRRLFADLDVALQPDPAAAGAPGPAQVQATPPKAPTPAPGEDGQPVSQ